MSKTPLQSFSIWLFTLHIAVYFSACVPSDSKSPSIANISAADFPNILNLKGIPDSATDRSVYAFSDLGAWHGYAIPHNKTQIGSFTGPFIMTQDNGIWISDFLSKMEIIDKRNNKTIDFKNAAIIESNAYPNKLKQIFKIKNPSLLIETQLIFVSSRSALIKVLIENTSKSTDQEIALHWSGKSFLDAVAFEEHPKGVIIDFGKNATIGWISTDPKNHFKVEIENNNYTLKSQFKTIQATEKWETYLTQTFCFSEKERQREENILSEIYQFPDQTFSKNEKRWNKNIAKILLNLNEAFQSKAHQEVAVKCLQTLSNNWRSAAGFLKHDGLFPSYNYEWFNGFWSWDSWKHAVAIANYDTELAQNQIRAMYDFQDEKGMIADCVYRDTIIENHNWRDTKPPLSAWAVWQVFKISKDKKFLEDLFPKIEKYHKWWYKYRNINQNEFCEYGSNDASLIAAKWESGMDNAVRFDEVEMIKSDLFGGSMNCESVDLNSYLFAEKVYLAKIAVLLKKNMKAQQYQQEAEILKQAIQQKFYNESAGWFFDIDLNSINHLKVFGAEGWIPLWTNLATTEQAAKIKTTMMDTSKFATYIPFPTLAADHPKFKPMNGYWRGPVWLDQAYFAIQGLRNYGYKKEAIYFSNQLFDRLEGLKNDDLPIRENYHPHTGQGLESKHFSWSAAHLLMLLQAK